MTTAMWEGITYLFMIFASAIALIISADSYTFNWYGFPLKTKIKSIILYLVILFFAAIHIQAWIYLLTTSLNFLTSS